MDREWEPNLEDERVVELAEDDDLPAPLPTIDPDERIEGSELEEEAEQPDV